ncbi:MAG: DUF4037 domain-containing protein [Anaerolineae bacterium]|jgi:hypothetical protein|nr:DUF4037 domain-containing protein [Anaerolineae bacterium]
MTEPEFIPGKELSRRLHAEVVQPLLAKQYPGLAYSAGRWGYGSEVLDFDTPMSRDHDWGPRLQVFLNEKDMDLKQEIWDMLANELPKTFYGYSTHFGPENPDDPGVRHMSIKDGGPVDHRVEVTSLRKFLHAYLPVNVFTRIKEQDWLILPAQKLRTIVSGGTFHDGLHVLLPMQEKLRWYPNDVWAYLLASGFTRIGQEEHLMGRAGHAGDEIGSAQIGAHLTRTIMLMAFWMEKQYPPYHKWFGTGLEQLEIAGELIPALHTIRLADTWQAREQGLVQAYLTLLRKFNALGLVEPVAVKVTDFFGRPFQVIGGGDVADRLKPLFADTPLADFPLVGSIDLVTSSTDVLENNELCTRMRALYTSEG